MKLLRHGHSAPTPPPEPAPDVRIQVTPAPTSPRLGRRLWHGVASLVDWALIIAVVGLALWAVGALVARHYVPLNPLTARVMAISRWESRVVLHWFARPKTH